MGVEMQKTKADEYADAADKRKFAGEFVKANDFVQCSRLLDTVFQNASLSAKDKQALAIETYKKFPQEMLSYSLAKIRDPKFSKLLDENIGQADKSNILVHQYVLFQDEKYIRKLAKHIAEIGPSPMALGDYKPLYMASIFTNMLIQRGKTADKDSAFKLANEIMKNHSEYSVFTSLCAASAMIYIDPLKAKEEINKERVSTPNMHKSSGLEQTLDAYREELRKSTPKLNGQD